MNLSSDYYGQSCLLMLLVLRQGREKLGEKGGRRKKEGRKEDRKEDRTKGGGRKREGRNRLSFFAVAQSLLTPLRVPSPFSEMPPAAPLPPSHPSPVETHSQ